MSEREHLTDSPDKLNPSDLLERESIRTLGNYLKKLRSHLLAYDVLDEIGKARELDEFVEALGMALRLSDNLRARAEKGDVFIPSDEHVKEVIQLASKGPKALKIVSRYLYTLAYTYAPGSNRGGENE